MGDSDAWRDSAHTQHALTAAHLYYLQGHTMEAIAAELQTSRSTVSRLLAFARRTGLVDIRIRSPFDAPRLIEEELHRRYGVTAHVAPVPPVLSDAERLERVAATAAQVLDQFIVSNLVIGIAWGATMATVGRHLIPTHTQHSVVVQLNGSGNTHSTGVAYATQILQKFAEACGAQVQQFPVPAFFDNPETRRAFWEERSTRRILDIQQKMGLVAFSVGVSDAEVPSHVYRGGYLEQSEIDELERDNVVGDIATVFYRADGSSAGIAMNERATGPALATLREVPHRVCVVSGRSKLRALRGALAAGVVTNLVIDESTAGLLLEKAAHDVGE